MASALNLDRDNTSCEMENKTSDEITRCSLCKDCDSTRKGSENPLCVWLTMDTRTREKHVKHMKNSSLAPLLFGRRMYYSSKNFRWLRNLSLVPRQNFDSCSSVGIPRMSNRLIEVAELAEEIVDTVLSCLGSEQFVHSSYHTYKELEDCSVMEEALSVGKRNEFVSLMSSCFNGDHRLDKPGIELLSLAVLHQAIKYICQTWRSHDYLSKFEAELKRQELACTELRLQGNDCFVAGDYQSAVIFYSQAITTSPFDPLLYGNRAQSFLKLKKLREALSDAKRAVYLNPEWEKGHYRFAQAYFELGFPEKAMAVNSLAQKCCSSTLNLLCQAVVFKREIEESSARNKPHCCSTSEEQTADKSHRRHQAAACGNPCSSRTKVGNKRNWKLANEKPGPHGTASPSSSSSSAAADKNTPRHLLSLRDHATAVLADEEDNNCDTYSNKDQDSDCELSDEDAIPALIYDSSDDSNDDDLFKDDSDFSSLPSLASPCDSDTESSSESDNNVVIDDGEFECRCMFCNDDVDDDDDDDDDDDFDVESDDDDNDDDNDDEDDDDSDEDDDGLDYQDLLRTLMSPPVLTNEISPVSLMLSVLHGFFMAHPEMLNEGTPPALPAVIESLPKIKITKDQVAVNLSCTICQCDYEEDETILELPCTHLFHPSCVITWLKMHATCPTCRDVLPH